MILVHNCHALPGVIVDTEKYEDKSNFISFQELGFLTELKIPMLCIFWFYPCTRYCLSKIMKRSSTFLWSIMHVMNTYVDNV